MSLPYNKGKYIQELQERTKQHDMFNFRTSTDLVLKTAINLLKDGVVDTLYQNEENRIIFSMLEYCGVNCPIAVTVRVFAEKLAMAGKNEDMIIKYVSHRVKEEFKNASKVRYTYVNK